MRCSVTLRLSLYIKEKVGRLMFSKKQVEEILSQLQREWGTDPQWEQLLRDVYLGMARADGGMVLGNLDPRVIAIIEQQRKQA